MRSDQLTDDDDDDDDDDDACGIVLETGAERRAVRVECAVEGCCCNVGLSGR